MKVYVACHDRWAACHTAEILSSAGVEITSRWHYDSQGYCDNLGRGY